MAQKNITTKRGNMEDKINHPSHYVKNAVVLEPMELTGRLNSCLGQAIQYIIRRKDKEDEVTDIRKAIFWLEAFQDMSISKGAERNSLISVDVQSSETRSLIEVFKVFHKDPEVRTMLQLLFDGDSTTLDRLNLTIIFLRGLEQRCA